MIGSVLSYIRKRLDDHLRSVQGLDADGGSADRVVFLEGDKLDPLTIPQRSIAMLVANVQEAREFRDADRFQRRLATGQHQQTEHHYPDIHLEIVILFVANFKDYATAWNQLSQVLFFFQAHPVFDAATDPDLPAGIGRLANQLCAQSFQEQNELWSALKTPLRPAILHRFRLITLRGNAMEQQPLPIQTVETSVQHQERAVNLRSPPSRS